MRSEVLNPAPARLSAQGQSIVEGMMEVVEFEPVWDMGVVIHEGPTETRGRVTLKAESQERTTLTISAEFPDVDESREGMISSLVERSARNIKQLIESEA